MTKQEVLAKRKSYPDQDLTFLQLTIQLAVGVVPL